MLSTSAYAFYQSWITYEDTLDKILMNMDQGFYDQFFIKPG